MSSYVLAILTLTLLSVQVGWSDLNTPQKTALRNFFDLYFDPKIRGESRGYFNVEKCIGVYEVLHLGDVGLSKQLFRKIAGGVVAVMTSATVGTGWTTDPPNKIRRGEWIALAEKVSVEPRTTFPQKIQSFLQQLVYGLILRHRTTTPTGPAKKIGDMTRETVTLEMFQAFYKTLVPNPDEGMIGSKFQAIQKNHPGLVTWAEWMKTPLTQSFLGILTLEFGEGESLDVKKKKDKGQLMLDWLQNGFKHLIPEKALKFVGLM